MWLVKFKISILLQHVATVHQISRSLRELSSPPDVVSKLAGMLQGEEKFSCCNEADISRRRTLYYYLFGVHCVSDFSDATQIAVDATQQILFRRIMFFFENWNTQEDVGVSFFFILLNLRLFCLFCLFYLKTRIFQISSWLVVFFKCSTIFSYRIPIRSLFCKNSNKLLTWRENNSISQQEQTKCIKLQD